MKKLFAITLICLLVLSGCKKEENKEQTDTKKEEKTYLTRTEMNIKLTVYGKEIYNNKKYNIVEKKDGIYFLSLNTFKDTRSSKSFTSRPVTFLKRSGSS